MYFFASGPGLMGKHGGPFLRCPIGYYKKSFFGVYMLRPGQILEDTRKEHGGLGTGGHTAEKMEYGTEWHRSSTNVCAPCGEGLTTVKPVHLALCHDSDSLKFCRSPY